VILELISDMTRSVGMPALKRAAGVLTRVLPIPQPTLFVGPGSSARLGRAVGGLGHRKVLLVTDGVITQLGLLKTLTDALAEVGTTYVVFDRITPDAPIPLIEQGIRLLRKERCDGIVAFGGGSVIDAAKAIGLAAANHKHPRDLVGYFKGRHGPLPIYAVPTTAGTGSEVTVAAVISDPEHGSKLVIADTRIVPSMAALDPCLTAGLPGPITAATGMDALTHAIEAYIGHWGTDLTDRLALAAVAMIYENLPVAFNTGPDLAAREAMALASTYAGMAFTRANVGNVHAIAHQLGGRYHTPHGLANAIMLPLVLRFCAVESTAKLAALALRVKLGRKGEPAAELARRFIDSIEEMNRSLGIPRHLPALREEDVPSLAEAACWEADTNYPVPRRMSQRNCEQLLRQALPPQHEHKPTARKRSTPAKTVAGKGRQRRAASDR
jgi:alcohol dehydrogenase